MQMLKQYNKMIVLNVIAMVLCLLIIITALTSCCRPATDWQVYKWERKYKFESPRKFWGVHIRLNKKNVTKYK